jgi:hypothetical protein
MDGQVVWDGGSPAAGVDASADGDNVRFGDIHGRHTFAWVRP